MAKTHLSRLLERVQLGEEIIIIRANVPIAVLKPMIESPLKRELGWARGEFQMPDDFDDTLPPEIEKGFCGE